MRYTAKIELDQHFLIDTKLIDLIISNLNLKQGDILLEIGPGYGNTTERILKKYTNFKKIILVEKDNRFIDELNKVIDKYINNNFKIDYNIINSDIIKEIESLNKWERFNKILCNTPYQIIEPLFQKLIKINFELGIFVLPKKTCDKIKLKTFSLLGEMINLFYNVDFLFNVDKNKFSPVPRVDSCVIRLVNKKERELTLIDKLLRNFFLLDKKKIKNIIIDTLIKEKNMTKRESKEFIKNLNIDNKILDKKISQLNKKEFFLIKNYLENHLIFK